MGPRLVLAARRFGEKSGPELLRGAVAGAGVGLVDALPLWGQPTAAMDAATSMVGCATLGLGVGLVMLGLRPLVGIELKRAVRLSLIAGGSALPPAILLLVALVEGAPYLLASICALWVAVALALQLWWSRHLSMNGVGMLMVACLVPALLTLHLLGVPARILIYPTLAMAAAAGVWLVFLAQAAALHLGYREPALSPWAGSAWHSALFAGAGLASAWVALNLVAAQYVALRWDLALLAWALLRAAGRQRFHSFHLGKLALAGLAALCFALILWRAVRSGSPVIQAARGGQLVGDVLAAVQSPAARLQALRSTIRQHPAYAAAVARHSQGETTARRSGPLPAVVDTVVLVTIEALPYPSIGYSGQAPAGLTPHLDQLAQASLRFHSAYAPASCTLLTLPAMLNSQYPGALPWQLAYADLKARLWLPGSAEARGRWTRSAAWPVLREPRRDDLPRSLAAQGFVTRAILNGGDTHVFDTGARLEQTFDGWHLFGGLDIEPELSGAQPVSDHRAAQAFEQVLEQTTGRKLFAWIHLYTPHYPYAETAGNGRFRGYPADLHLTDEVVGRILRALRTARRYPSSIVVITGDHGESFGNHGIGSERMGRHGLSLNERQVHVPLLLKAPGVEPADVGALASGLDIAPTILAAVGAPVPPQYVGEDLRVLAQSKARPSTLFLEQWLLAPRGRGFAARWIASIDEATRRKTVLDERRGTILSFDLKSDPGEERSHFDAAALSYAEGHMGAFAELLGWRHAILRGNRYSLDHLLD